MNNVEVLSEEQLDFLGEMMNIGAGNAATALTQMVQRQVNLAIPKVHVLPAPEAPSILDDPSLPVLCIRMGMVGDAIGDLFFIVPDEQKENLTSLVERAVPWDSRRRDENPHPALSIPQSNDVDLSVLTEVGNIIAGVYLTAIHDFCGLNIYHCVPTLAVDMIQSLLDESFAAMSSQVEAIIVIENEFVINEHRIRTFFLFIPDPESVKSLVNSIGRARMAYGAG